MSKNLLRAAAFSVAAVFAGQAMANNEELYKEFVTKTAPQVDVKRGNILVKEGTKFPIMIDGCVIKSQLSKDGKVSTFYTAPFEITGSCCPTKEFSASSNNIQSYISEGILDDSYNKENIMDFANTVRGNLRVQRYGSCEQGSHGTDTTTTTPTPTDNGSGGCNGGGCGDHTGTPTGPGGDPTGHDGHTPPGSHDNGPSGPAL